MVLSALIALLGCPSGPVAECSDTELITVYTDADQDTWGDDATIHTVCKLTAELVTRGGDCDDARAEVSPDGIEECDGLDNDCDSDIDEDLFSNTFYIDGDGDGFGDPNETIDACAPGPGVVANDADCNDGNALTYTGAPEFCDGEDNDCDGLTDDDDPSLDEGSTPDWFKDSDGDGAGDGSIEAIYACAQPSGAAPDPDDCNDLDANFKPGAPELCDGEDNDCDGLEDESDPDLDPALLHTYYADVDNDGFGNPDMVKEACSPPWFYVDNADDCDDDEPLLGLPAPWLLDGDGDGYGAGAPSAPSCTGPTADHVIAAYGLDCLDTNAAVYPGAEEVCNGIDDNCDALVDDNDPLLDLTSAIVWYSDGDHDTFGNPVGGVSKCIGPVGKVANDDDCDDTKAGINPNATEICNGGIDDDCDTLLDDDDPDLDAASQDTFYADLDGDGVGDDASILLACDLPEFYAPIGGDCDDTDPDLGAPTTWLNDVDGDGYGAGAPPNPALGCTPTAPGTVPSSKGLDCGASDPSIYPGAPEDCGDGVDQDCDTDDAPCLSCLDQLELNPGSTTGLYTIAPDGLTAFDVWCDMTTDGGGWTLVSSSTSPVDDAAAGYSTTQRSIVPGTVMSGIWDGMRTLAAGDSDIRFACKTNAIDGTMKVDLSFYEIHWYEELTAGNDAATCFNEADGAGYDSPAPERRNNLTGTTLALGDDWNAAGYLEGEDTCGDAADFTVDFDDRGMNGNPSDGTDWGEAGGTKKCGTSGQGGAFFIFVREL